MAEAGIRETEEASKGLTTDELARTTEVVDRVVSNVGLVILGKEDVIKDVLAALLAEGHVLLEDVPGVGKTMMARALAKSISAEFRRIQFTPDLLPADVTGTNVYNQKRGEFFFNAGPVFANILLADEINRTSPRTQSSLLEAMEERQVTVDGVSHQLPKPFFVIATQNPIEHAGTYDLPEAQLDRFLLRLKIGYPDAASEESILEAQREVHPIVGLEAVISIEELVHCQQLVRKVYLKPGIRKYIVRIGNETRQHPDVLVGASIRGSLGLMRAAQARAIIQGRDYVIPDDIKAMATMVLGHRIILHASAQLAGIETQSVTATILKRVPVPVQ